MTDIEKLAAALEKRSPNLMSHSHSEIGQKILYLCGFLNISLDQATSLVEGTHVVVPVEPSDERINAARPILLAFDMQFHNDFRLRHHFKEYGIGLPEWAEPFADVTTVTKAMCAEMIYRAMTTQKENSNDT